MKELNIIQTKLNAPKNQRNTFGNYNYRSCEDILEALKPLLKETGCTVVISDIIELIGDRYYIKATATITNEKGESVSNSAYAREPLNRKGSDESQITGATSSYARKYCLNGLFCIDDNKDPDAMNTHDGEINTPADKSSGRNKKKPTAPPENLPPDPAVQQIAVQQSQGDNNELARALQELTFVTSQDGLTNLWKAHPALQTDADFVKAVKASPYHPNNINK